MFADFSSEGLLSIRKGLGYSQTTMAGRIGLSLRAYQDLEGGATKVRPIHVLAAERVALNDAVTLSHPMMAPAGVRRDALDLAAAIRDGA